MVLLFGNLAIVLSEFIQNTVCKIKIFLTLSTMKYSSLMYNAYWFAIIVISPEFGQGCIDTYTFSFSRLHIILLNLVSPF